MLKLTSIHPLFQKICVGLIILPVYLNAQMAEKSADALKIRSTANFDVDGSGNAEAWRTAEWIPLAKRKGAADYSTRAKLLYSETGLYVLFSCEDKKITATLKEDFAKLWEEDVVEIFLWTDQSIPIYFEYELSPLNYELPILVPNLDGAFFGWRPWQYEGSRKARHATKIVKDQTGSVREWIAEFFIPYTLLTPLKNVPPQKGTQWRINMYRNDFDENATSWSWKPVTKNYHDYEMFGAVAFD
jgi:hypothetical protein